jgi:hypothetical protein
MKGDKKEMAQENKAVAFGEWLLHHQYVAIGGQTKTGTINDRKWMKWIDGGTKTFSTQELFNKFEDGTI